MKKPPPTAKKTLAKEPIAAARRVNEQEYRNLVETSHDLIWSVDIQGRWTFVNAAVRRIYGYEPAEMLGRPFTDFQTPAQAKIDLEAFARIKAGTPHFNYETVHRRKDGSPVWLSFNAIIRRDNQGAVLGTTGTAQDITERRQSEMARDLSLSLTRATLESTADGILVVDTEGKILTYNHVFLLMWRMPDDVLASKDDDRALQWAASQLSDPQHFIDKVRHLYAHPQEESFDTLQFKNGRVFERYSRPQIVGQQTVGRVWSFRDITERKQAEQALRESEANFRALFEQAAVGVTRMETATGRFLDVNRKYCEITGYSREELLQTNFQAITHPEELVADLANMARLRSGEIREFTIPKRHVRKDGTLVWLELTVSALWPPGEAPRQHIAVVQDVTARRQAEIALLESGEKFQAFYTLSPLALVLTTIPDGRVADANVAAELLLGRKLDDVRGKTTLELNIWVDPADRDRGMQSLQREGVLNNFEVRMRRKDGFEITVLYNGRVIYIAGQAYALNSLLDISARKQAEAERHQAKQMFEDVVQSVEGIVWEADAQTLAFTFVSPQAERMLGYPLSRWTEEPTFWSDHIHPDDRERAVNFCRQSTKERRDHEFEYRMLAADGRVVQLRDIVTVVVEQNQAVRLRGLILDITKQKMLEEHLRQTQKMEAIGQLSGGVAHDLNNLLTVVKGHTGLLRARNLITPEIAEPVQQIEKAADRAASLTRHLLAFSRQQIMQPVVLNLNGMVFSLTKMLRRLLSESIEMVVECAPQPLLIRADEGMVEQVLLNLVVNARDALPSTGSLRITTGLVDFDEPGALAKLSRRPGAFVCLVVSDTGSGIPPEILPRIFEPFFTTKEIGKGTGLGLASAYGIMQQHGGWIEAESEVGRGTTLRVYFPRLASAVEEKSEEPGSPVLRGGHEGILLVEDESAVREVAEVALVGLGYRVFPASDGRAALQVWDTHRHEIQLLLTDLVMPGGISGRDLALRLRTSAPKLPVIYMSGYSKDLAGGEFPLKEDANFLTKPFDLASLASMVRVGIDRGASNPPFAQRPV